MKLVSLYSDRIINKVVWGIAYEQGLRPAAHPLPALPLRVVYPPMGYTDMMYIDSLQYGEDDPVMRCYWDFYLPKDDPWYGKYQVTYTDAEYEEILAIEEDHSNSCKCEVCRAWGA